MVFSFSEEFRKIFTQIASKRFKFSVCSLYDLDSLIVELVFVKFHVIYLDVDSISFVLKEALIQIRNTGSKNREALIHLITSYKENHFQLEKFSHSKNILLLWEGKEIKYLKTGKQYIY